MQSRWSKGWEAIALVVALPAGDPCHNRQPRPIGCQYLPVVAPVPASAAVSWGVAGLAEGQSEEAVQNCLPERPEQRRLAKLG